MGPVTGLRQEEEIAIYSNTRPVFCYKHCRITDRDSSRVGVASYFAVNLVLV